MLTVDEVRKALPPNLKSAATPSLVDALNDLSTNGAVDPEVAENIREGFITYANVLKDGKYKLENYMNAIAYVTFKMMGYTNQEAYARTFPQRYAELTSKGTTSKDISSYVSMFHKGKLVQAIMDQAMIPVWLLNNDKMQEAIDHQFFLMKNGKSEMVQHLAAKSLMETLKKPEAKEINLNIGATEDSGLEELRAAMLGLAQQQQMLIEQGVPTQNISHQKLLVDVTPSEEE